MIARLATSKPVVGAVCILLIVVFEKKIVARKLRSDNHHLMALILTASDGPHPNSWISVCFIDLPSLCIFGKQCL